ncbi:MAG: PUR family DNA/RNA-binding protein [Paludibacteraceae bacterium]|nr:PUR family DNA/RNA-binding protein [Paludibacteraceae bacterium]
MESRRFEEKNEPEIVYSHSVKAGKRIYYLDVKKARNEDLYLCITESKKKQAGEDEAPQFEKHKVFLYREDFDHFKEALQDVIGFVEDKLGKMEARPEWNPENAQPNAATAESDAASEEDEPKKKGLFGRFKKA